MTLSEQIIAYLQQNNISFTPGDYKTGQPQGQADQILVWNAAKLGAQPTATQLTNAENVALMQQAQTSQIQLLSSAYQNAIATPVSYTSKGGVTKTYQADPNSVSNLQASLAALTPAGATPTGFYWVASDNTQVPFTLADLQGLAAAIMNQGWTAFQHLQTQKNAVMAATTVSAVQSIVW